jgi:Arc/MetJ-type ribon-helix-helix transcriptional regulator
MPQHATRALDSEKITANLGNVDLLVREGFYSNRIDFIRTAVRNQLERHGEAARNAGEVLDIRVLGLATIA